MIPADRPVDRSQVFKQGIDCKLGLLIGIQMEHVANRKRLDAGDNLMLIAVADMAKSQAVTGSADNV